MALTCAAAPGPVGRALLLALATAASAAAASPRTTILPLGDSITFGCGDSQSPACIARKENVSCDILQSPCAPCAYGYRYRLFETLNTSDPNRWGFVGTLKTGPLHKTPNKHAPDVPDGCDVVGSPCAHEGHPGWKTTDLSRAVVPKIGTPALPAPDVILLHIGTNDIGEKHYLNASAAATETAMNLKTLIGQLIAKAPGAHVFVASIIAMPASCHFYGATANLTAQEEAYNMLVPGVVASFGPATTFVDMKLETGLCDMNSTEPSGCCPPQLHPNGIGYAKMAAVWAKAIAKRFPPFA